MPLKKCHKFASQKGRPSQCHSVILKAASSKNLLDVQLALTISTPAIAQNTSMGHPVDTLEVNVFDIKLAKEIRLNTQLVV